MLSHLAALISQFQKNSSFLKRSRTHQTYPTSSPSPRLSEESGGAVSSYVPPETAASSRTGRRDSDGRRPPAAAHSRSHAWETEQEKSNKGNKISHISQLWQTLFFYFFFIQTAAASEKN